MERIQQFIRGILGRGDGGLKDGWGKKARQFVPASLTINQLYMRCCDFKELDLPLQANAICQRGIYLSERVQGDCFIALYQVHDFYVEVYCRFRDNNIIKLVGYHNDACLEPYLAKVNLDGILPMEQCQ